MYFKMKEQSHWIFKFIILVYFPRLKKYIIVRNLNELNISYIETYNHYNLSCELSKSAWYNQQIRLNIFFVKLLHII